MSSTGGSNESPGNKSPGKGAKSLELMQQRLKSQAAAQQAPTAQQQQQQQQQQPNPQASVPAVTQQQQPMPHLTNAGGRSKGKDFASMNVRRSPPAVPSPQQQQQASRSQQLQQQVPMHGGKPKGKDFTAMASRLHAPPQHQQHVQPHPHQLMQQQPTQAMISAQAARAAQMQAAARAAAGLPPLERPTATTVTTIPPNIPPPKMQPQGSSRPQQLQRANSATLYSQAQIPQQQPQPAAAPYAAAPAVIAPAPPQQKKISRSSSNSGRRSSGSKSAPKPKKDKPTPTPTAAEARVSAPQPSAHMAPLVGQRIQDLIHSLDPNYTIEPEAEEQVLQLADDFLDKVVKQSIRMAQHRGSRTLDVQDVQLILAKQWGIVIPGLPPLPKKSKSVPRSSSTSGSGAAKRKSVTGSTSGGTANKTIKTNEGSAAPASAAGTS